MGIGPSGRTFAGALFAAVASGDMSGIVIGARTGSSDGRNGQYGVFYNAVPDGGGFNKSVWVDGLQQNTENRSNLALVNTGEVDDSPSVFQLDIYDGATGMLANTVTGLTVGARGWRQINGILGKYATGANQGYVRISKRSGTNPFLAYGVINDGGAPGERSGDGAYMPATEAAHDAGTEPMTDREVLEVLYHATGGPSWVRRINWLSAAPLSDWQGVRTDGNGRVTGLYLAANAMNGRIPAELGGLTELQYLEFAANQLDGAVPAELGQLVHLQELYLGYNELSGEIPSELGKLSRLRTLSLVDNPLSGAIPPELGRLPRLQTLNLAGNLLSGRIPPDLAGLTRLQELDLRSNRLSGGIPPELGEMTNLSSLTLQGNYLRGGVPPELGLLARLQTLYLWDNPLTGAIPKQLQQLSGLLRLNIRDTDLCVPADPAFQAWLATLFDFRSSGLVCDGTRRVLFSASSYEVMEGKTVTVSVRLIDQTEYPVPSTVITLTAEPSGGATTADYSGLRERVTIRAPLNEASFVVAAAKDDQVEQGETIMLGFRGPLPSGITAGDPDTATVKIHDPRTEDTIDREVLEALYRATGGSEWSDHTNWLSAAPLSEWFGVGTDESGRATGLNLGFNGLSGTIPPELAGLTNLQVLNLGHNLLRGTIPPELAGLTNLQVLNLGHNLLRGEIPSELGRLSRLQSLDLGFNGLRGTIPPELARLTNLQVLNLGYNALGYNQLRGTIPPELAGLTNLQVLNLGHNLLRGEIPPELSRLSRLQRLHLGRNLLSGGIPLELVGLSNLQVLNLARNQLSGAIPVELAGLINLYWLSLDGNELSAERFLPSWPG